MRNDDYIKRLKDVKNKKSVGLDRIPEEKLKTMDKKAKSAVNATQQNIKSLNNLMAGTGPARKARFFLY